VPSLVGRLFLSATRVLSAPAAPLLRWVDARRPSVRVEGVAVVVHPDAGPPGPSVAQLGEALALLAATAPRRLRRLRGDVARLLVEPWSGTAGYSHRSRAILFDPAHLRAASPVWVAAALVHEATHARLSNRGVRPTARNLARVERRCCAEQVDFLRRLPPECAAEAARSVAWIEQCLAAPEPWYGPRAWALRPLAPATRRRVEEDRARGV
jgi:hypothetical protein